MMTGRRAEKRKERTRKEKKQKILKRSSDLRQIGQIKHKEIGYNLQRVG
jgi:hypothetical protein